MDYTNEAVEQQFMGEDFYSDLDALPRQEKQPTVYTEDSFRVNDQTDSEGRHRSLFVVKESQTWMDEAAKRKDPKKLWHSLWFEGELCCLFADTNVGKTIYAVQMARNIAARGYNVLYLDFELSDKQFQMRYTNCTFPPNFLRAEMRANTMAESVEAVLRNIEQAIADFKAEVVIVDNITWICNSTESGDIAGMLMSRLVEMKRTLNVSILCLAHTPKRSLDTPITQNTLAGSKRLANFMDSIFAIGIDRQTLPSGRYLKQIKVRNDRMRYGEENVIRYRIDQSDADGFLGFRFTGFGNERLLISEPERDRNADDEDSLSATAPGFPVPGSRLADVYDDITELLDQGVSKRNICKQLRVSNKTIYNVMRLLKERNEQTPQAQESASAPAAPLAQESASAPAASLAQEPAPAPASALAASLAQEPAPAAVWPRVVDEDYFDPNGQDPFGAPTEDVTF